MAPRLRVKVFNNSAAASLGRLGENLNNAGHDVRAGENSHDIEGADLVVVDSRSAGWVQGCVDKLVPFVRDKQMLLHTCLTEGTQLFDEAELHGAIPMAAHEIMPGFWVTSATDELGEAVVSMLLAETHDVAIPIKDSQRPRLAAAQRIFDLAQTVGFDAVELMKEALPVASFLFAEELEATAETYPAPQSQEEMERFHNAITDPAVARFYAELERRHAERTGNMEAELWALSKTMRKDNNGF
ncbi:hypothetical protein [Corynebacterium mayonis]|uniref:6PGD fold domain-containing protein n=1 Tax=Corynebacterium mayonis TaxID=3062461 RepID=UPI0031405A9B